MLGSSRHGRRQWLTASPIHPRGQAAWILEKFWAWTDCNGHPENILSRDELLDNVMLYWVTATAASSARLLGEFRLEAHHGAPGRCTDRSRRFLEGDHHTDA